MLNYLIVCPYFFFSIFIQTKFVNDSMNVPILFEVVCKHVTYRNTVTFITKVIKPST